MTKLKINGLMKDEDIAWKKISCTCDHTNIEKCFPISKCTHCYCQKCEDSMPRKPFDVEIPITDKNGRLTGKTEKKTIKEITIDRTDDGYNSIRGWSF